MAATNRRCPARCPAANSPSPRAVLTSLRVRSRTRCSRNNSPGFTARAVLFAKRRRLILTETQLKALTDKWRARLTGTIISIEKFDTVFLGNNHPFMVGPKHVAYASEHCSG